MWTFIFIATTVVFAVERLRWKILTLALIYYIDKNQYKQPTKKDMTERAGFVGKNMIKDLFGRSRR